MGKSIEARLAAIEKRLRRRAPGRIFVKWEDGRMTVNGKPTGEQPGPDDVLVQVVYGERPGPEAPALADDNKALGGAR